MTKIVLISKRRKFIIEYSRLIISACLIPFNKNQKIMTCVIKYNIIYQLSTISISFFNHFDRSKLFISCFLFKQINSLE